MRNNVKVFWILAVLVFAGASSTAASDDHGSIVIVFKDGHRQTLDVADIARIDFKAPAAVVFKDGHRPAIPAADIERIEFENTASASWPSRHHFVGKWEVGDGNGSNFYITLGDDGEARKTRGSSHGTGWWLMAKPASAGTMAGTTLYARLARSTRSSRMNPANRSATRHQTSPPPGIRSPNLFSRAKASSCV